MEASSRDMVNSGAELLTASSSVFFQIQKEGRDLAALFQRALAVSTSGVFITEAVKILFLIPNSGKHV